MATVGYLTLYFVGDDDDEAFENPPFGTREGAEVFRRGLAGTTDTAGGPESYSPNVYTALARIDPSTIERVT